MIRPLNPETDARRRRRAHPRSRSRQATTTVESWLQQHASIPPRAQARGAGSPIVDDTVVGRAEAGLNWFSESGLGVRRRQRPPGVPASRHRQQPVGASSSSISTSSRRAASSRMFIETPEGVEFARARGFAEVRAETLSCVDPRTVERRALEASRRESSPLRDVSPEEVYEVDMVTTADVPMTEAITDDPVRGVARHRSGAGRRSRSTAASPQSKTTASSASRCSPPTSSAAVRSPSTRRRCANTGRRGLAEKVKRASLRWAAENGIRAAWTTNDETNAPMLAMNRRLGYSRGCAASSTCATLAQRKRLPDERGQDLRGHPHRRRRVGARVAIAAVRPSQLREERERALPAASRRPRRTPGSRAPSTARPAARPADEAEAAARSLKRAQVRERARDRLARAHPRRAAPAPPRPCRSSRARCRASTGSRRCRACDARTYETSARGAGRPLWRSARICQTAALTAVRLRREAREQLTADRGRAPLRRARRARSRSASCSSASCATR